MSARIEPRGFVREALFGLLLSVVAAACAAALGTVLPDADAVRLVVAGLALAYLLHSLAAASEKTGRVVVAVLWAGATAAAWLLHPSGAVYVLVHVGMIWLVRSLYLYSSFAEALLDFALSALAVCFGVWAALRTESLTLAVWSFFLIQALHVNVPRLAARFAAPRRERTAVERNRFSDAFTAADDALRRIAARR